MFPDMTWFLQSAVPAENLQVLREHVGLDKVAAEIFPQIATINSIGLTLEDEGRRNILVVPGLIVDAISSVHASPSPSDIPLYTGLELSVEAERKRHRRDATLVKCREWR